MTKLILCAVTIAALLLTAQFAAASEPAPEVTFSKGSAKLTQPARRALGKLARELRSDDAAHVHFMVSGHAGDKEPLVLATARANAIDAFLQRRGVDRHRIHTFADKYPAPLQVQVHFTRKATVPPKQLYVAQN